MANMKGDGSHDISEFSRLLKPGDAKRVWFRLTT